MPEIDWFFPKTGGGVESGINDAGIVTFDGAPLSSLAREILQNSVDARAGSAPVHVAFEIRHIHRSDFGGLRLAEHIENCVDEWQHDEKAKLTLESAQSLLQLDKLPVLGVIDSNTTGLEGESWRGLVKTSGASFKSSDSAGGSFGVGKMAPFTLSPLRTVFYWSCFEEKGYLVEKLQGKAVLVSHKFSFEEQEEMTQAIGFYGITENCAAIDSQQIPVSFKPNKLDENEKGTAIWLLGFNEEQGGEDWRGAIARSVVSNFFFAINKSDLVVLMEPGESEDDRDLQIDSSSLQYHFEKMSKLNDDDLHRSQLYWELIQSDPTETHFIKDFGTVKLWIGTEDNFPNRSLPNRTAMIRRTGMLITDEQSGHAFRGLRDYVAVCVVDDDIGNELLRGMENPAHNQFEFERLPTDEERTRGRQALNRLRTWIREKLKEHASPVRSEVSQDLDELAEFIFDDQPGAFTQQTDGDNEPSFGKASSITFKRRKKPTKVTPPIVDTDDEGEIGDEKGEEGGSNEEEDEGEGGGGNGNGNGDGHGTGHGDGTGGSGDRGGNRSGLSRVDLTDVRIIVNSQDKKRGELFFTSSEHAKAIIKLEELGDSSSIRRNDVNLYDEDNHEVKKIDLSRNVRYRFTVIGEHDINAAWQVFAIKDEL